MRDIDGLVQMDRGRIHMRIYSDPELYRDEMRRVFHVAWLCLGHESEVPNPGDFKTAYMGGVPVIVVRDEEGALNVLVNRCLHRGATVCQLERGNARHFRCEYHAWTYNSKGELVGLTRRGYGPGELASFPTRLAAAPRVATYRGLVFASLSPDGPSLEDHLGLAKAYLDEWADKSPTGMPAFEGGVWKHAYQGNWKLQLEGSNEGYHPDFLHKGNTKARERMGERPFNFIASDALGIDLGNGHSLMEFPRRPELIKTYPPDYVATLTERLGRERAEHVLTTNWRMQLFPNCAVSAENVRLIRPVAVDRTEVWQYHVALPGAPATVNRGRIRNHTFFYGPAGYGAPDDLEIFERIHEGCRAAEYDGVDPWVWLNRGLETEKRGPNGERIGHTSSEVPQRAIYYAWASMMKGESPITITARVPAERAAP